MSTLPVVLMYHSIAKAEPGADPFDLHVSQENFRSQIEELTRVKRIVSLAELAVQVRLGRREPDTVALTFDDAYENNLSVAAPILRRAGVPATLFVAPGLLGREEFWWNRLIGIIMKATRIPTFLSTFVLIPEEIEGLLARLRQSDSPNARAGFARRLCMGLQRLDLNSIDAALAELTERFAPSSAPGNLRPMRESEVREAAATFDIGAHTLSHPMMTRTDPRQLVREIVGSKEACEELSGRPVPGFAYPYGDVNPAVAEEVSRHFAFACTTRETALERRTRPALIPRIHVYNWSGVQLLDRILHVSRRSRMPRPLWLAIAAARDPRRAARHLWETADLIGTARR